MKLFSKLKFGHDPKRFKLKIEPVWYSGSSIQIKYSANNGITWKTIHYASSPILIHDNWEWKILIFNLLTISKRDKERFSSYQKILDYTAIQYDKLIKGQNNLELKRKELIKRKEAKLKEFNN